jgi:hypothetical protein
MKFLALLITLLMMAGCGYSPMNHYAKNVVGESVSTEVIISMEDPQNTVIVKDAVDMAVITKFRTSLVAHGLSKTHLKFAITSVTMTPLRYDINGYVVTYRMSVAMAIERTSGESRAFYNVAGMYDFDIRPNAIVSDQARFEAIRQGAQKGIDNFLAQVAAQGARPQLANTIAQENNSTGSSR